MTDNEIKRVKKTQLQWAKDGYVLNKDAKGTNEWNNGYHAFFVTRYYADEVNKNPDEAQKFLKEKRKKAYQKRKKREKEELEFVEWRTSWNTEYQWLQSNMIPNDNAKWHKGYQLNEEYNLDGAGCFGDDYDYCFIDDVHMASSEEELQDAFSKCTAKWKNTNKER